MGAAIRNCAAWVWHGIWQCAVWQTADAFAAWISPVCHTHFAGMPQGSRQSGTAATGHNLKSTSRLHLSRAPFRSYIHLTTQILTARSCDTPPWFASSRSSRVLTARDKRLCRPGTVAAPDDPSPFPSRLRIGAWHGMSARDQRGLGRKSAEASGIARANGERACPPEACLGLGRGRSCSVALVLSPDAQRFLGGAWFWRGLPCACCTQGAGECRRTHWPCREYAGW